MSWRTYKFGDFLHRSKIPIDIEDGQEYKRVTIKTKHQGVSVRDTEKGKKIGTKKQFVLKAGQFVLSKIDARYGAFGIAPDEVEGAIITGNFWAYDVDFSIINIEWFNQFTNSQDFYDVCERASSGITHRKYLNEDFFLNYEIELPDVEEQLAIVEEFKKNKITLETQSTELTHQLDLVKLLRQAFLREAMQGRLVPQDENDEPASVLLEKIKAEKERLIKEQKIKKQKPLLPITEDEIPFEIPDNWVWCRLGELVLSFQNGISSRGTSDGDKITVLRLADITNNFVDLSDRREITLKKNDYERYLLNESDLLITRVNGSLDLVGNFNYVGKHEIPVAACDHFVRMTLSKDISSSFIFLAGKMDHLRRNIEDNFKTTSGQKTVNQGHLSALLIAMPPNAEQQRIVAKLDELMAYCDDLEVSIKKSQQQNELLLLQVLREALEPKEKEVERV